MSGFSFAKVQFSTRIAFCAAHSPRMQKKKNKRKESTFLLCNGAQYTIHNGIKFSLRTKLILQQTVLFVCIVHCWRLYFAIEFQVMYGHFDSSITRVQLHEKCARLTKITLDRCMISFRWPFIIRNQVAALRWRNSMRSRSE